MAQLYRQRGNQRGLFGGLGDHGIARRQRRAGHADEDRQREVPRGNRGKDTAPVEAEGVLLPRRPRQMQGRGKLPAGLGGIIAQKVHRLAQFEDGIEQGLARLTLAQRQEFVGMRLEQFGRFLQQQRAGLTAQRVPAGLDRSGAGEGGLDFLGRRIAAGADHDTQIMRHGDRCNLARGGGGEGWRCLPLHALKRREPRHQRFAHQRIGKIDPGTVRPRAENVLGQRDRGIAARLHRRKLRHRITDQFLGRDIGIAHAVDEAGVGPVLKQAAHQIGEQFLVPADGRVNPHGRPLVAFERVERIVNFLAHAVQALEFEWLASGQVLDRPDRIGVVRRKGRADHVAVFEQARRTSEVAHIGCHLAGEHRVIAIAAHLRQLHLAVPVSALDQPDEQLAPMPAGELARPVAHRHTTLLIGLNGKTKALPSAAIGAAEQIIVCHQFLDDVEAQFQPLGLLGVDGEVNIGIARADRQRPDGGHHRSAGRVGVENGVLGIERRELDRNAGRTRHARTRLARQPDKRGLIGLTVLLGIGEGHRRFAQHIKGMGDPPRPFRSRALQSLVNGAAEHELAAEDLHRLPGSRADHRLAQPGDRALQHPAHAALPLFRRIKHFACQHQRKGRRIDESGRAFAQMLAPFDRTDLVADQRIGGRCIGHAQQRLGQTHQRDAFFGIKPVLLEERVNPAGLLAARALDQGDGQP